MAVTKAQKVEILNDLVAKFKEAKSIGFATTNCVTVEEFSNLRKNLREVNATYTLAKKTIIKKALKDALNIDVEMADLQGQIGVVCSNEDAMAGLEKVNAFLKEANGPKGDLGKVAWAVSVFEGELKTTDETKVLASMPSRETLLGRLVGSMKSPISALARFFDAAKKDLEAKDVAKVGDLKNAAPKVEAPKEEVKVETPAAVVETPVVEETAPVTEEVSVPTVEATIEVKEEETPVAEEVVQTEAPAEVVAEEAPVEEASTPEETPAVEEEKKAE